MRFSLPIIAIGLAGYSQVAFAEAIPVEIHWAGVQPKDVTIRVPGGFRPLTYDSASKSYKGSIEINSEKPQRRTFVVTYDTDRHPIDLRVHRFIPKIEFGVEMQPAESCTEKSVVKAGDLSTSAPEALINLLSAGQLLSIQSPNDCDKNLAWQATQARYRQNVRLMQFTTGLFLIAPQFADAYRQAATSMSANGNNARISLREVEGEIREYSAQEKSLEAVQLANLRDKAMQQENFALAASISEAMYKRVTNDKSAEAVYTKEGTPKKLLEKDTSFLKNLAEARGQELESP